MTGAIQGGDGSGVTLKRLIIAWGITIPLAISPNVVGSGTPSPAQWALFVALLSPAGLPFVWTAARALRRYAGTLVLLTLLAVFLESALPAWHRASHGFRILRDMPRHLFSSRRKWWRHA